MNIEDLRIEQANFEGKRQELKKDFIKLNKLRKEFVSKFSEEQLRDLPLDKYVIGKGDSFCYWLENKLEKLGSINGATAFKFGIYFGRTKRDSQKMYRFRNKFGHNVEVAYLNIKKEIISLIENGKIDNLDELEKNKLSCMFKGKILSTYYPDKYLNVFSDEHLDFYIEELGLVAEDTNQLSEIRKRNLILQFKNLDSVMKNWSIYEFSKFLYYQIGWPIKYEKAPQELRDYIKVKFPPLKNVNPVFIDLKIVEINHAEYQDRNNRRGSKNPDFEKQNRRNKKLGERGELIVMKKEKEYLNSIGKVDFIDKIKQVSHENINAGYDIISYDEQGKVKYIEVKSTTSSNLPRANFIISSNELKKAKELDNYFIYIVFEANSTNPKIQKIKKPLDLPDNKIEITPISYRVNISLGE